jgi:lysophospholipase L1-like esterase
VKRTRRLKAKLSAIVIVSLVTAGLTELGLRLLGGVAHPYRRSGVDALALDSLSTQPVNRYLPSYYPKLTVELQPDLRVLRGASERVTFSTDEYGFRNDAPVTIEAAPGQRRVFAVGGSTTECLYLALPATWTEQLQDRLGARGAVVDVVNAGHSGDTTRDHIALLAQRIVPFHPDAVVFLVGINDLVLATDHDYSIVRSDARSTLSFRAPGLYDAIKGALADHCHVFRAIVNARRSLVRTDERGNPVQDVHGSWVDAARRARRAAGARELVAERLPATEFEQNLKTLIGICQASGVVPVLATQPTVWGAEDPSVEETLWVQMAGGRVERHAMSAAMDRFNGVTRRIAAEMGVVLADLAGAIPATREMFYDDDHFTTRGASLVADVLASAMMADGPVRSRIVR